ncbi:MAG: thiamine-phosphate kinase [Desulfovibrionaceae bacterium]|nr:thiamine-phosphate kinase [Desulfovibrionaceae bacterium]
MRTPRSEDDILALLSEHFPVSCPALLVGRGDDCAVLRPGGSLAVTCDVFVEDVHFRRRYFSAADIGHKALAVNLSDLASAGARPLGFVLGLTLTGREDETWLHDFAEGMARLARRWGVGLAGGDLARARSLHISITAWGEVPAHLPRGLRRARAQEGDILFLVGSLGMARVGLNLLETADGPDGAAAVLAAWPAACSAHLRPGPLVDEGRLLARLAAPAPDRYSLMDVSDGLARDLPRLLGGRGAELELPAAFLPDELRRYAAEQGLEAASFAFEGGEDYALAGTCPPEGWADLIRALPVARRLGVVTGKEIVLNSRPRPVGGFDHFA